MTIHSLQDVTLPMSPWVASQHATPSMLFKSNPIQLQCRGGEIWDRAETCMHEWLNSLGYEVTVLFFWDVPSDAMEFKNTLFE